MADSSLSELKAYTKAVTDTDSLREKIQTLNQAFSLFSQETTRLETAYNILQKRFQSVNQKLEETNRQLNHKLIELDETTTYLANILSSMTQGILYINKMGVISTYNQAAEHILEMHSHDILNRNFCDFFKDDAFGFSVQHALDSLKAPELLTLSYNSPMNQIKDLEISTSFVTKGNSGIIILIRDITKFRKLQIIANRNDRLKELGEMAASVAHEIRNPLGGIGGFAALLCRDLKESPHMQNMAQAIVDGTKTLNRLVTDVLQYAHPVQLRVEKADLIVFINECKQLLEADPAFPKNINIHTSSESPHLFAHIDKGLLKAAIFNLMTNAVQAMPFGGILKLSVEEETTHVLISVEDTGIGIPESDLEKIFSPFFTTKTRGTGIGLAEVHKVIQAHGGNIEVISIVNKGSCFKLRIPTKL